MQAGSQTAISGHVIRSWLLERLTSLVSSYFIHNLQIIEWTGRWRLRLLQNKSDKYSLLYLCPQDNDISRI